MRRVRHKVWNHHEKTSLVSQAKNSGQCDMKHEHCTVGNFERLLKFPAKMLAFDLALASWKFSAKLFLNLIINEYLHFSHFV